MTLSETKLINADGGSKYARIGNIVDYILENFDSNISAVNAAEMAGMSFSTFGRNFLMLRVIASWNLLTEFGLGRRVGCSMLLMIK